MLATTLVGLHGNQLPICGYCLKIFTNKKFIVPYLFMPYNPFTILFCIYTRQHIALFFPHKIFFGHLRKKEIEKKKSSSLNSTY